MKKEKKNKKNNFKQILFNIILVLLIFILIVKLFNLNNNYENSKITKESFQNNENYYNKIKFAVMWASTTNIGDDIQTLAAINLLKKNNITEYIYIDREKLSEYDDEPVVLIMNGWYMHDITKFPPSSKITPIFISVYINNEDIVKQNINYFKKYEPIGCRDIYTTNLFKKYNIKSYFSGCLTLTFDEYNKKNNKIYIVDLKGSNGGFLDEKLINLKSNFNKNDIEYINHDLFFKTDNEIQDVNFRMEKANELINKYKKAKLILTSRLHCVLPSRAFNTNVKFIHKNYNTDKRFKGLDVIINGRVDNIENIPSTIDRSVINNFKESIKNKFKKLIQNFLTHRKFNTTPSKKSTDIVYMTNKNYTITGKTDGFGAQYQALMSGIAYCKFKNYNYIHTPFKKIAHNGNIKRLNNFIGIPKPKNNIKIEFTEPYSHIVHYSKNPSKFYTNDVIAILRNYYYSTSKPNTENVDIAIHIRRGDINNEEHPERYTLNSYYNKIIQFLNNKYPKYNIVIFSEGSIENFNDLNGKNISFKLNKSIEETFHSFVTAKILVTAKSSFSYSAAILNSNEIYYIDFWHKPLKNWKIISDLSL